MNPLLFLHSHISVLLLFFCFVSWTSSLIDTTHQTLRRDKAQTEPKKTYTPHSLLSPPLSAPAPILPHLTVYVYIPEIAIDFRRDASFSCPSCICHLLSTADSPRPQGANEAQGPAVPQRRRHLWNTKKAN